jgi:hypothetical protein
VALLDFFPEALTKTSLALAAMETYKTSSTVVIVDVGEHLFNVAGHSRAIGVLTSETFRVGGHDWAILYYPNGDPLHC